MIERETLIVNLDYCGHCAGTCPTCVLSEDERMSVEPFLSIEQIEETFLKLKEIYKNTYIKNLVIGIGRGNTLALPEAYLEDVFKIPYIAAKSFQYEDIKIEISTSLIGKYDFHVERGKYFSDRLEKDFETRFVIVANPMIEVKNYWRNIRIFVETMQEYRGGKDGSGDIILLNLTLNKLPDIDWLSEFLQNYKFPINLTWTPAQDFFIENKKLHNLNDWLFNFYKMAKKYNLDSNIINHLNDKLDLLSIGEAQENIKYGSNSLIYVDKINRIHNGLFSIYGDLDPIRYTPINKTGQNLKIIDDLKEDMMKLRRNRVCRSCEFMPTCVYTGAYKVGLLAFDKLVDKKDNICPSGLKKTFLEDYMYAK